MVAVKIFFRCLEVRERNGRGLTFFTLFQSCAIGTSGSALHFQVFLLEGLLGEVERQPGQGGGGLEQGFPNFLGSDPQNNPI